jgi:alpha/beta superfamily hydrolase
MALLVVLVLAGIGAEPRQPPRRQPQSKSVPGKATEKTKPGQTLDQARRGFKTRIVRRESAGQPVPRPPAGLFRIVRYDAPGGKLAAYLSRDPRDGQRHPAIIWITGGDCNTIDEGVWKEAPPLNDQSASAFRKAGIPMMYPSLRGGNDNPGFREGFFGEVDDVLAAADYLARQSFVDPQRIYLGGHSTGATLVLLVAASTDRFRAVFSFGPADDVSGYEPQYLPFDTANPREIALRSPGRWLHSMRCPVFLFEGTEEPCNFSSLAKMARTSRNPLVHTCPVKGANHFSILFPVTKLIAGKILGDTGPKTTITFQESELNRLLAR